MEPTNQTETIPEMRKRLFTLRQRFLKGDESARAEMYALAAETAAAYNTAAKAVAKRMGVKPRLMTAERMMKAGELAS